MGPKREVIGGELVSKVAPSCSPIRVAFANMSNVRYAIIILFRVQDEGGVFIEPARKYSILMETISQLTQHATG